MIVSENHKVVARSADFDGVNCSIDEEDMRYISSLLRNNYSDSILATIRETFANAVDATVEHGKSVSEIIVKMPSMIENVFSIRDFGRGLSKESIFRLYSKYGKSTKRTDNESIGGFGIGRFAPLSYNKDGFTVTSFWGGEKRIYHVYVSESNDTKIDEIHSCPSDEPSGILISVGVSGSDIESFLNKALNFFKFFSTLPKFEGLSVEIKNATSILSSSNWQILDNNDKENYNYYSSQTATIGGIPYPFNFDLIKYAGASWLGGIPGLVIDLPIGSVSIHHSREALEYNKSTREFLQQTLAKVESEMKSKIKEKFDSIDCLKKAKYLFGELKNCFRHSNLLSNIGPISFANKAILSSSHFDCKVYDSKINGQKLGIPVMFKELNKLSDGKISFCRAYNLPSSPTSAIVLHDLDEGERVVNRVYSLFDTYKQVFLVRANLELSNPEKVNGVEEFAKANHLDLVKNDLFKLSELASKKIPAYSKKGNANASPNYFLEVGANGSSYLNHASAASISDTSITNIFFKTLDSKPSEDYEFLRYGNERGRVNTSYISLIRDAFFNQAKNPVKFFGVSSAIFDGKKMKSMTHFVELKSFLQNKWQSYSEEQINSIIENIKYSSFSACDHEWNVKHLSSIVPEFSDFLSKKKNALDKMLSLGISENELKLWDRVSEIKDQIKIDFRDAKSSKFTIDNQIEIDVRYPLLKVFFEYERRCYSASSSSFTQKLKYYMDLELSKAANYNKNNNCV